MRRKRRVSLKAGVDASLSRSHCTRLCFTPEYSHQRGTKVLFTLPTSLRMEPQTEFDVPDHDHAWGW